MKCAYLIENKTAVNAMLNIDSDKAKELAEQGWIVYEEEVDWCSKEMGEDGLLADKPVATPQLVEDPYVPTPEEQRIHDTFILNAEYDPKFEELRKQFIDAQIMGDDAKVLEIRNARQALQAEYDEKLAAINA